MQQLGREEFLAGARTMQEGARIAREAGNLLRAGRFANAAGSGYLLASDFRDAMVCFRQALAHAHGLLAEDARLTAKEKEAAQDLIAAASVNLASLYLEIEDPEPAQQLLTEAAADLRRNHPFETQILFLRGQSLARQGVHGEALEMLTRAVDASDRGLNWDIRAAALHWKGIVLTDQKRLEEAEACLLEAFRVRVIHRQSGREVNLRRLALLELERGDAAQAYGYIRSAEKILRRSDAEARHWRTHGILGQVLQAMGRDREALQAYRRASDEAARWRAALIPSFSAMAEADSTTAELSTRYANLTARLAASTDSPALAAESLFAVARQRAASMLRLQSRHAIQTPLGPEYLSVVSRLRRLEMSTRPEDEAVRRQLRRQAVEMETKVLPGFDQGRTGQVSDATLLRSIRSALPRGSSAIVFLLGTDCSWRWVVGRTTLQLKQLPPKQEIATAVDRLRVSMSQSERARVGAMLLSGLPTEALDSNHWFLSLDGPLFSVPFAALSVPGEPANPLVLARSVQVLPALLSLLQPVRRWRPGPLLAVADPIYNMADPRLPRGRRSIIPIALGFLSPKPKPATPQERPRLAASLPEATTVQALWTGAGYPAKFLTGAAVEARTLSSALSANPAVIHIAAHIDVEKAGVSGEYDSVLTSSTIALSLHPDGTGEALPPEALIRLQLPSSVVVMSGCDSGRGKARPGLGLTGLSQAWLLGGASAVAGSLWPVRDQASNLFVSFYRALADGLTPARALRHAQMEAIRAGGWQADPFHWAAWTITGI